MNFLPVTVLFFGIFKGFNAQPSGNFHFVCRDGEEYDMCRSPCEPTCDSIKRRIRPNHCPRSCVAGCFCKNGYVRAGDNTCVPPEQCLRPQCPENEEYQECGSPCALNCTNLHEGIFCSKPCQKGCFCKPNFVRDSNGKCVDPRSCNRGGYQHCPVNEHYVTCVDYCNTCWENPYCSLSSECTPGCDCKPGYYKNSYGKCVTAEECSYSQYGSQEPCGVNEVYTCVNPCNDCVSRGRCDYEQHQCTPGCDCKQGFFRNQRGVCVPERYCFNQCQENEIFLECGPACRSTCENYKRLRYHPCKEQCIPGCFCRGNFVIGPSGKCIAPENCPLVPTTPLCPPGEVYYNCMPCPKSCDNLNASCPEICRPGCACERGLVRKRDGRCIRPNNCRIVCGPNQEYHSCGPACPPTCENLNQRPVCTSRCVRGCFCKSGFVMEPNGRCIPQRNCPTRTDVEGRRGGTDEDNKNTTMTTAPSTEMTLSVINTTQTENLNTTVLESTERTTTDSNGTDAETTTKVKETVTTSKVTDSETTTSKVPDTTTAPNVTDVTTAANVSDTTSSKATTTTINVEDIVTTSKVTDARTIPEKTENSPTTEKSTQMVTTQTSSENNVTETSVVTNATETSKTEMSTGATVITTDTPTLSGNTTAANSTAGA